MGNEKQIAKTTDKAEETKFQFNQKRTPGFKDSQPRYRCPASGLWRRYYEACYTGKGENHRIRSGWDTNGDLEEDKIGTFFVLENGIKVYNKFKGKEKVIGEASPIYKEPRKRKANVQIV